MRLTNIFLITLCISILSISASARDNHSCGIEPGKPLENHYGPYDFTNPQHADRFPVVLKRHFTDEIRLLTAHKARSDLDYTLRAIPNHLPALASMSKLQRRWKKNNVTFNDVYSAECYFKRAMYFAPRDNNVRYLFAFHQHQVGALKSAETLYLNVLESNANNIEAHYNLGLLLVDMGKLEAAKEHAQIAYAANFPLEGLKNKLIEQGFWN